MLSGGDGVVKNKAHPNHVRHEARGSGQYRWVGQKGSIVFLELQEGNELAIGFPQHSRVEARRRIDHHWILLGEHCGCLVS